MRLIRPRGLPSLLFRLLLYVSAIAVLFFKFAPVPKNFFRLPGFAPQDSVLIVSGADLAPGLIAAIVQSHRADYPKLRVDVQGGGSAAALEALANARADVAFLARPPSPAEQALIREARKDTALWAPVAVGGLVLVRGGGSPDTLSVNRLRALLQGESTGFVGTLYAPDPNQGLWDALTERLGLPPDVSPGDRVTFLADETQVIEAVRGGRTALGLVGSLSRPEDLHGLVTLAVAGDSGAAAPPADDAIATGRYPLFHQIYVACLDRGGMAGSMFLTSVTSDRGQRRIERAGYLPARRVLREIVLSTNPVGRTG